MAAWGGSGGAVAAAMIARQRRKILAALREAGALAAGDAKPCDELGLRRSLIFRRLVKTGIVVDAGGERYYLDEEAAARAQHARLRRVQLILSVVTVALIAIWILGRS